MKILKIFLKIGNFQKSRFFGGSEGGFVISNPPEWFYISLFIDFFIWGSKKPFYPKNQYLKIWISKLFGGLGGSPSEFFFSKNGSKSSTITRIKKSLSFGPQKITLKLIYGCIPIGGLKRPPCQIWLMEGLISIQTPF